MSVISGVNASISTGLILDIDASNRRSWGGTGIERVGGIYASWSNWGDMAGTSVAYNNSGKAGVHLTTISNTSGGVNWWNSTTGQLAASANTRYVVTAKVKYNSAPSVNLLYLRQYNSGGSQVTEYGVFNSSQVIPIENDYYLAYAFFVTTPTTATFLLHGYEYTPGLDIWLEDVQCRLAGWSDLSSTPSNLSIVGTPTFQQLGGKWCFNFAATSWYFTGTMNGVQPTTDMTISTWIYPMTEVQADDRACLLVITGGNGAYMSLNKSTLQMSNYWYGHPPNLGYHETGAAITRNTWNNFICVWNYSTGYAYQYTNGVKTTSSATQGSAATGTTIWVGNEGGTSRQFSGGMALLQLYNVALADAQVLDNFNSLRGRFGI